MGLKFGVLGSEFRVQGSEFIEQPWRCASSVVIWASGSRAQILGFMGLGFRVMGSGFRVWGLGFRV